MAFVTSDPFPGEEGLLCCSNGPEFMAVGGSLPYYAKLSADGLTWGSGAATLISVSPGDCCWSDSLSLFLVVGASSNNAYFSTSPDAVTWTTHGRPPFSGTGQPAGCCWSPELGVFCAVGYPGTTPTDPTVALSADGANWGAGFSVDGFWNRVCWSPDLMLFCAVGSNAAGDAIMTSPDGSTWTPQGNPFAAGVGGTDVCWAAGLGLFVAVAQTFGNPGDNDVATSPDGINWTGQGLVFNASGIDAPLCVAYGLCGATPTLFAGGYNGVGPVLVTSADGAVWTDATSPLDSQVDDLCFGDLGFLAAGRDPTAAFSECAAPAQATQYQRIYGWRLNISDDALETVDPMLTSPESGLG